MVLSIKFLEPQFIGTHIQIGWIFIYDWQIVCVCVFFLSYSTKSAFDLYKEMGLNERFSVNKFS
jgi:hypothetical protein